MRDELKLYTGGELDLPREMEPRLATVRRRSRWARSTAAALAAAHVETVCCDHAHALGGPFTSGPIARNSFEHVLPNTLVEPTPADHFTEEERRGRLVPDQHPDEHATCYVVQGRGLVVISSCGHCGMSTPSNGDGGFWRRQAACRDRRLSPRRRPAGLYRAYGRRAEGAGARRAGADALHRQVALSRRAARDAAADRTDNTGSRFTFGV